MCLNHKSTQRHYSSHSNPQQCFLTGRLYRWQTEGRQPHRPVQPLQYINLWSQLAPIGRVTSSPMVHSCILFVHMAVMNTALVFNASHGIILERFIYTFKGALSKIFILKIYCYTVVSLNKLPIKCHKYQEAFDVNIRAEVFFINSITFHM